MKKFLLGLLVFSCSVSFSQTAVNFNVADCSGNNHDLFAELNSGKVVVLCWVMPCSSCISPALSAQTEIGNHLASNPGKILYYMVDDFANTNCTSLTNWCNSNGITASNARFSNAAIKMSDYGTAGMPKIVIIAGSGYQVFFNENNGLNVSNFNAAMNNAIAAANAVSVKEHSQSFSDAGISPNPAGNHFTFTYTAKESAETVIEIYNPLGQKVRSVTMRSVSGKNTLKIETSDLVNGTYFIKINGEATSKLVVSH
jgi:hypothetical protein